MSRCPTTMPLACGTLPPGARSPRSPALAGRLRFPGVTFSHVACQLLDYTPRRSVGWGSVARLAEVSLQGVRAHLQRRDRDRDHPVAQEGSLARPSACVHPTTAYRWRHRFLSAAALDKPQTLPGDCGSGRNLHSREAPARSARHPHQQRQRLPFAPQGVAASLPRVTARNLPNYLGWRRALEVSPRTNRSTTRRRHARRCRLPGSRG